MRVVFVLSLEVNPKIGGVERVTHVLSEYFMNKGIKIDFLYFHIKKLSFPQYNKNAGSYFLPDTVKSNSAENINFLNKLILENEVDIIINQSSIADSVSELIAEAVKNTRCKIISILHGTPFTFKQFYGQYKQALLTLYQNREKKDIKSIIKRRLAPAFIIKEYINSYKKYFKISVQSSDRFVLLSDAYIPLLDKTLNIKRESKIIAVPNPSSFDEEYAQDKIEDKKKQVIYVGRLDYNQKRVDRLLTAWSLVENNFPEWQLIIVGGSLNKENRKNDDYQVKEQDRLEQLATKLNLNKVTFAGNTDPVPYYKESSVICLTSNYEGFPMVLIEAIQFGVVPVVFGSFEAVHDLIETNKNGMIATPFNTAEFDAMLSDVMINDTKRNAMAVEAINTSKKYTLNVIGNQWIKIFNEITQNN